jgi:hypothetical protein
MPMGYRGNPDWRDMSEYAVHFAKAFEARDAYDVMMSILWDRHIMPSGPYGAARNLMELIDSQRSACLSEIPLDLLVRLIERRSLYGIGFLQDFLVDRGGARVWYLDRDGAAATTFAELVRQEMIGGVDPADPLWRLTPLVDYPGDYGETAYRFEWEREWRVPGGLRFEPDDVSFLFLPEEHHAAARAFFEGHYRANTGPAYLCPYIDPRWEVGEIQDALADVPPVPWHSEQACAVCGGDVVAGACLVCGHSDY